MQNNIRRPANNAQNESIRREMMRRNAAKEKRRRMLKRNRIISSCVICVLVVGIIYAIVHFAQNGKDKKPPVSSASTAISQSTPASGSVVAGSAPASTPSAPSVPPATAAPTEWNMLLANANNPLPEGYVPEVVKVDTAGHEFDSRASVALTKMLTDGNATGLKLMICSAYRSTERQTKLFNEMKADNIAKGMTETEAYDKTKAVRAIPGTSEHETGLAADIVSVDRQTLDSGFDSTPEFAWLDENAYKYGFILRYPREKSTITGIIYEPWHYRYVGEDAAKAIKDKGVCLEEYLDEVIK